VARLLVVRLPCNDTRAVVVSRSLFGVVVSAELDSLVEDIAPGTDGLVVSIVFHVLDDDNNDDDDDDDDVGLSVIDFVTLLDLVNGEAEQQTDIASLMLR